MSDTWTLPTSGVNRLAASAGGLTFVGGAGDFDGVGEIRNPGLWHAQLEGSVRNAAQALKLDDCDLSDVLRVKVLYSSADVQSSDELVRHVQSCFRDGPSPAITLLPVVMQPWREQIIQLQLIAKRAWRTETVKVVEGPLPGSGGAGPIVSLGLRAGEVIVVPGQLAERDTGAVDGVRQTHEVMKALDSILHELGATFSDTVKVEGYYYGTDMGDWEEMAAIRREHFTEPGPVGTVVPWHAAPAAGAVTQVEVLAMRERWNHRDKYIPREDAWPRRVWDWPIPVPYRQGIRLRDAVWLGGQVPFAPGSNDGSVVFHGDLRRQTQFVMTYIDDLLGGLKTTLGKLALLVCHFESDGSAGATERFVETLRSSLPAPLPPLTLVPSPAMHSKDMKVEIWGVAAV